MNDPEVLDFITRTVLPLAERLNAAKWLLDYLKIKYTLPGGHASKVVAMDPAELFELDHPTMTGLVKEDLVDFVEEVSALILWFDENEQRMQRIARLCVRGLAVTTET